MTPVTVGSKATVAKAALIAAGTAAAKQVAATITRTDSRTPVWGL